MAGGGGGFSLFGGLASALGRKEKRRKSGTNPASMLSPENIRARVEELRRNEVLDQAARVSRAHVAMADASTAFNQAVLATDAGRAFEAKLDELAAAHPEFGREKIREMSKNGTLAGAIGSDPLKPLATEVFKSEAVKAAWAEVERHADDIEKNGKRMLERMKEFEQHFPRSVDADRLNKVVEDAMERVGKGFDKPMAQSPQAVRSLKERLEVVAKQVKEFVERMLAKFSFGR